MNNFKKIGIIVLMLCSMTPVFVSAQAISGAPGTSEANPLVTCGNDKPEDCGFDQFIDLVQKGVRLVFVFASFIATGMFIYAGFLMLTAVGNMTQITKAKTIFTRVIVGFLIMFMAYLLVQNLLKNLMLSEEGKKVIGNIIDL